jgi:hypothetical protein
MTTSKKERDDMDKNVKEALTKSKPDTVRVINTDNDKGKEKEKK